MTELPVVRIEHLSITQRKAFMLADNKLAEAASWDETLLELSAIDLDFDIEATGFAMAEIDLLIEGLEVVSNDTADELPQAWDTASKVSELSDYSVCTTWGVIGITTDERQIYLLHVARERLEYPPPHAPGQRTGGIIWGGDDPDRRHSIRGATFPGIQCRTLLQGSSG
jgi:hypothetical protein